MNRPPLRAIYKEPLLNRGGLTVVGQVMKIKPNNVMRLKLLLCMLMLALSFALALNAPDLAGKLANHDKSENCLDTSR